MKVLPTDVRNLMKKCNRSNRDVLYEDDLFICVYDLKHDPKTEEGFHYTAWCKEDIRSLLDLDSKHAGSLLLLQKAIREKFKLTEKNSQAYIHFPPSYWRLHIHFVAKSHKSPVPHQLYPIGTVAKKLRQDGNYYRKHVTIPNRL